MGPNSTGRGREGWDRRGGTGGDGTGGEGREGMGEERRGEEGRGRRVPEVTPSKNSTSATVIVDFRNAISDLPSPGITMATAE